MASNTHLRHRKLQLLRQYKAVINLALPYYTALNYHSMLQRVFSVFVPLETLKIMLTLQNSSQKVTTYSYHHTQLCADVSESITAFGIILLVIRKLTQPYYIMWQNAACY